MLPALTTAQAQKRLSEREREEARVREQYNAAVAAMETEARKQFERDLQVKRAESRKKFLAQIEAEKATLDFEAQWAIVEGRERAAHQTALAAKRAEISRTYTARVKRSRARFERQLTAGLQEAKRQAAMREKTYAKVTPRILQAYKTSERLMFKEAVAAEEEVFKEEQEKWEAKIQKGFEKTLEEAKPSFEVEQMQQLKGWEEKEKKGFESELELWEEQARAGLETEISEWKLTQEKGYEEQMVGWRKTWKPKGYAEKMLEWKAPDLPTWDVPILKIRTPQGTLRVGLDIGKFFEGLAEGSVAAGAGLVASVESLAYGVAGLAGIPAPRPPPTLIGATIHTAIVSGMAGEWKASPTLEALTQQKYAFTYATATLLGDILLMKGLGKVTQKLVVEPLSKTRVGTYIGYQFKVHAPKLALRLVYGKKGAEYIFRERLPYTLGVTQYVNPAGQVITETFQIPKAVEAATHAEYLKELWLKAAPTPTGAVPWTVIRGEPITPFKVTLSKAITHGAKKFVTETKGVTQIMAPVAIAEKVFRPELPALAQTLQFGVVPFAETIPMATALATIGLVRAAAPYVAPKPALPERLRPKEPVAPVLGVAEAEAAIQIPAVVQVPAQVQAQVQSQIQLLQQQLKLELPKLPKEKRKIKKKKPPKLKPWEKAVALLEYPVVKEKELPRILLEGLPMAAPKQTTRKRRKGMSLSNVIFGENKRRRK